MEAECIFAVVYVWANVAVGIAVFSCENLRKDYAIAGSILWPILVPIWVAVLAPKLIWVTVTSALGSKP